MGNRHAVTITAALIADGDSLGMPLRTASVADKLVCRYRATEYMIGLSFNSIPG